MTETPEVTEAEPEAPPPVEEEQPVDPNAYDASKDPEVQMLEQIKEQAASSGLPIVKQCQDPEHFLYGAVAVDAGPNRWGVMHPRNGGHWATNEEVWTWTILTAGEAE